MDNDNKIKKSSQKIDDADFFVNETSKKEMITAEKSGLHEEVMLFLDDEVSNLPNDSSRTSYNLEYEYSKTKKNHSPFTIHILFLCFVIVVGTVFFVSKIIANQDKKIAVELAEFSDLNLKSLLDSVSKVQTSYDEAVKERDDLVNDKEQAIKSAEAKREQDLFVISSMHLTNKADEKRRISKVNQAYENTLSSIDSDFNPKIAAANEKVEEIDSQLKSYDASKLQAAQEQEKIINSERQVQELEKRRLTEQYEQRINELQRTIESLRASNNEDMFNSITSISGKYQAEIDGLDPVIVDATADELIVSSKTAEWEDFDSDSVFEEVELNEDLAEAFEVFQKNYDDYFYLNKSVAAIPQKNTIPSYVEASNVFVNNMSKTFEEATLALQSENDELYEEIDELEEKKKELEGSVKELQSNIEDLNVVVEDLKYEVTAEKKKTSQLETERKALKESYEECILNALNALKYSAMIMSAESKDNIRVYVIPKLLEDITEDSVLNIEIKAGKTIKGTLLKDENDYFLFEPAVDKQGIPVDFSLDAFYAGLPAKVTVKK